MEIDNLKEQRTQLWKRVRSSHSLLIRARKLYYELSDRYQKDEAEYEECDKKLAMLDGRFVVVQPATKHSRPMRELTKEEIYEIAEQLGISLDTDLNIQEDDRGESDDSDTATGTEEE